MRLTQVTLTQASEENVWGLELGMQHSHSFTTTFSLLRSGYLGPSLHFGFVSFLVSL